jgi:hypothetical protein
MGMVGTDILVAKLIGLFHDVGRFRQLIEYNTFNDSVSTDHAQLSVDVIDANGLLSELDDINLVQAKTAIFQHNKLELPKLEDKELLLSKILRDADKLDILKVISDYYENKQLEPNHTLTWELPVGEKASEKVVKYIEQGKLVPKKFVNNQRDIKILQLSWVFDLNFKSSFKILLEKRYMEKIYRSMPKNNESIDIYRKVKIHIENQFMG